jgi:ankyrin repeat protein
VCCCLFEAFNTNIKRYGGIFHSALRAAAFEGHESIVRLLIKNGAKNDGADLQRYHGIYHSALRAATYKGHLSIVQILIDNGADVNEQYSTEHWVWKLNYANALHVAAVKGNETMMRLLLKKGAIICPEISEHRDHDLDAAYRAVPHFDK